MARDKGSLIEYGKISVYSSDASINDVFATFSNVLVKFGYPEEDIEYVVEEEGDEEDDEENEEDGPEPWDQK